MVRGISLRSQFLLAMNVAIVCNVDTFYFIIQYFLLLLCRATHTTYVYAPQPEQIVCESISFFSFSSIALFYFEASACVFSREERKIAKYQ